MAGASVGAVEIRPSDSVMPEIVETASGPEASPLNETFVDASSETDAQMPEQHGVQTNGQSQDDKKPQSFEQKREHKRLSQFQRVKNQKAEYQKREAALKEREERIAQAERAKNAPKKPDYTAAELKQYRQAWENEGRFDLAEAADKELKRLEALEQQEHGQVAFVNEWHQAERELGEADPEFGVGKGTRLDKKLSEIMSSTDGNIYRQHPRGIVAAYHRAKMEILEGDHKAALGKIQQLETELKRLTGLTSIGGGAPGRIGSGNRVESLSDFSKLSSADMLKHLKSQSNKGGMPWL
jgi:hypothetical protein